MKRTVLRVILVLLIVALIYPALVLGTFLFASTHNAELGNVDAIIVLGCPSNSDGSPTPEQRERVLEAVREYQKGTSHEIIMSGAAAHNRFVEAHSMALLAEQNGVPASAIIEEDQAKDTIQNIYYSEKIMAAHGWRSVEVISSPYHLPRAALIMQHYPQTQWKTHPAQWPPEYSVWKRLRRDWDEALYGFKLRVFGFKPNQYLPTAN